MAHVLNESADGRSMNVIGAWEPSDAVALKRLRLKRLCLDTTQGFSGDAAFLQDVAEIDSVRICGPVRNLEALLAVPGLRQVTLDYSGRKLVDLSRLTITDARIYSWSATAESLLSVGSIRDLDIHGLPYEDLACLGRLSKLERLRIERASIRSLDGLEAVQTLQGLLVFVAPRLVSVDALSALPGIEVLMIREAPILKSIAGIGRLRKLWKLVLMTCKEIESLEPLRGLPNLHVVSLSTMRLKALADYDVLRTLPHLEHAHVFLPPKVRPELAANPLPRCEALEWPATDTLLTFNKDRCPESPSRGSGRQRSR